MFPWVCILMVLMESSKASFTLSLLHVRKENGKLCRVSLYFCLHSQSHFLSSFCGKNRTREFELSINVWETKNYWYSGCKSYYITTHPLHQVISLHSPFELVPVFSMQDSRLTSSRGESLMQLHKSSLRRKHWPIHVSTDNELLFLQIIMIGFQ